MARKLFGTDGIRGTANIYPMTAEVALKVGMAAGQIFTRGDHRHTVVIGKDTRLSGYMLEPALAAGFIGMGMDVIMVGPMPTPAVAMLTRSLRADLGVMISASHNAYEDNGLKLFGPDGYKLSDATEAQIEALVADGAATELAPAATLGRAKRLEDAEGRYIEFAKNTFPKGLRLDGLKIVIDCANGAAYKAAPAALWELGADVVRLGVSPDGFNINKDCGSTNTELMRETVVMQGADLGIALDGDADRVMIADENGQIVDGDQIMALVAESWRRSTRLLGGGIVSTVMSNLGLEKYLETIGLSLVRTQVGDRYVVEHMLQNGYNIGGEQSGHIVLNDYNTTGDGLIAALEVLGVLVESGKKASDVCRLFDPYPQLLRNVGFSGASPLNAKPVKEAVKDGEARLGDTGRLLIRPSGTEPLIRVMAEGEDEKLIAEIVDDICAAVEQAAG
ncbi:MAG: phosphoglucosamine mutase [Alphaproteobacteria bacterium]|nr:phosphoglucosamine mutase [Alphaproteobacteria bacterium]